MSKVRRVPKGSLDRLVRMEKLAVRASRVCLGRWDCLAQRVRQANRVRLVHQAMPARLEILVRRDRVEKNPVLPGRQGPMVRQAQWVRQAKRAKMAARVRMAWL